MHLSQSFLETANEDYLEFLYWRFHESGDRARREARFASYRAARNIEGQICRELTRRYSEAQSHEPPELTFPF